MVWCQCEPSPTTPLPSPSWQLNTELTEKGRKDGNIKLKASLPPLRPFARGRPALQPAAKTLSSARSLADTRQSLQSTDAGGGAGIGLIALIARDPELAACHAVQCSSSEEVGEKGGRAAAPPWKIRRRGGGGVGSRLREAAGEGKGDPARARTRARVRDGFVGVLRQVERTLAPRCAICAAPR